MDEQIIQALEKIQKICEENSCDICPFSVGKDDCGLNELAPHQWTINKPDDKYRYFR